MDPKKPKIRTPKIEQVSFPELKTHCLTGDPMLKELQELIPELRQGLAAVKKQKKWPPHILDAFVKLGTDIVARLEDTDAEIKAFIELVISTEVPSE